MSRRAYFDFLPFTDLVTGLAGCFAAACFGGLAGADFAATGLLGACLTATTGLAVVFAGSGFGGAVLVGSGFTGAVLAGAGFAAATGLAATVFTRTGSGFPALVGAVTAGAAPGFSFFFGAVAAATFAPDAAVAAFAARPRFVGAGGGGGGGGASGFRNFNISVRERSFPSSNSIKTSFEILGYSGSCGVM